VREHYHRLSQTECGQLRTRAAEAGLSISAYLRSCTFEAETLRSQVKEALAQLRTGEPSGKARDVAQAGVPGSIGHHALSTDSSWCPESKVHNKMTTVILSIMTRLGKLPPE